MTRAVLAKLSRLQALVQRREGWRADLNSVRRLHTQVLEAEHILSGDALRALNLPVKNATVGRHFDSWCERLRRSGCTEQLSATERRCLEHFLHVTDNMREHLIHCYDLLVLPRTNNDMEGFIRAIKTREKAHQWAEKREPLLAALWQAGGLLRSAKEGAGWSG